MKDSVWYSKLWHDKMQEFPVQDDANAAWQKMQALLDGNMPVLPSTGGNKSGKSLGYNLMLLAVAAMLAALLYYAGTHLLAGHKPVTEKYKKHNTINNPSPKNSNYKLNLTSQDLNQNSTHLPVSTSSDEANRTTINKTNSAATSADVDEKTSTVSKRNTSNTDAVSIIGNAGGNHNKHLAGSGIKNGKPVFAGRAGNSHITRPWNLGQNTNNGFTSKVSGNISSVNDDANGSPSSTSAIGRTTHPATDSRGGAAITIPKADTSASLLTNGATNKPSNAPLSTAKGTGNKKIASTKKTKPIKPLTYSTFEFGLNFGAKTNRGVFAGVTGTYYINTKLGIGVGVNVSQRLISEGYDNSNYKYSYSPDTGKAKIYTADKLVVSSLQKIYTVDVPVLVTYKISQVISLKGGVVIGIPVKTGGSIKTNLGTINNPVDTIKPYRVIDSAAHNTVISNKVNFSLSGGIHLNLNRFSIDADYVQGLSPYTISSSLGSGKTYYHSFQLGVGYILFKSKAKK